MKIAIWKTGHEIADTVAEVVARGLSGHERILAITTPNRFHLIDQYDVHIGYGILRGMADVFRLAAQVNKPWICLDRGYWKPGHYDGYYRVSLGGTQQTKAFVEPAYERWDSFGIPIERSYPRPGYTLVCPPTDNVKRFFNIRDEWLKRNVGITEKHQLRFKCDDVPIDWDWTGNQQTQIGKVTTFNSSVGWEALRRGIMVKSNSVHSIVGAYQKQLDKSIHDDLEARRRLFAIQAALQLTLDEIRCGKLWPLMETLLST